MSITALDILKAAREYAADPNHIVRDPCSVYESEGGEPVTSAKDASAVRGCVLGIEGIVATRLGIDVKGADTALTAAISATRAVCESYMTTMLSGPGAVLDTYDRAIAALEATS